MFKQAIRRLLLRSHSVLTAGRWRAEAVTKQSSCGTLVQDEELRTLKGHSSSISSVVFSLDGKTLASRSADDGTIRLWEVASGQEIKTFKGHSVVSSVAFSPDGKMLASGGWDSTISAVGCGFGRRIEDSQRAFKFCYFSRVQS